MKRKRQHEAENESSRRAVWWAWGCCAVEGPFVCEETTRGRRALSRATSTLVKNHQQRELQQLQKQSRSGVEETVRAQQIKTKQNRRQWRRQPVSGDLQRRNISSSTQLSPLTAALPSASSTARTIAASTELSDERQEPARVQAALHQLSACLQQKLRSVSQCSPSSLSSVPRRFSSQAERSRQFLPLARSQC